MTQWLTDPPSDLEEPHAIAHSENETFTGETWQCTVSLKVRWADRYEVFNNIIANELEWPYSPDSGIIAVGGTIRPFQRIKNAAAGDQGSLNSYEWAQIDLQFMHPGGGEYGGPGDETDAFYNESIEPNAEMLKLNPKNGRGDQVFYWSNTAGTALDPDAPVADDECPTRLIVGLDYVVRYVNLSFIPTQIMTHIDKVNHDTVVSPSLGISFAAETLLLSSARVSRQVTSDPEANKYELEVRWSIRKDTWNKFWDPRVKAFKTQWYVPPVEYGSAEEYKNYPLADMTSMLP